MSPSVSVPCCALASTLLLALAPASVHAQATASAQLRPAASRPQPAPPTAGATDLAIGSWVATLPVPGKTISLGIVVSQGPKGLAATLDIPGGTVRQRRLHVTERADTLQLLESSLGARFTCVTSADGQTFAGICHWAQIGVQQSIVFHRGSPSEDAAPARAGRNAYVGKWESGPLENGRPAGLWNYYVPDAAGKPQLARTYDHSARQLRFARPENAAYDAEVSPGKWERVLLSQAPWFIGPHDALARLGSEVNYPEAARLRRTQGTVYVSFAVDTLGRVTDHQLLRGIGSGCDEEALRLARTIPDTWTPGRLGARAVAARYILPIEFKL